MTVPGQRRRKGLDAVAEAVAEAAPAVYLVPIDGIYRAGLTVAEFSAMTTLDRRRIYALIDDGQIPVVPTGSKHYVIPVSALATWQASARPVEHGA